MVSTNTVNSQTALKEEAKALMSQRDALEQELAVHQERLKNTGAGMHGSLVDEQGFPRGDAFEIRQDRQTVIRLKNDLRALTELIEERLHALHAAAAAGPR